ncbi:MAG TPA: hypothetical protein VFQ07_05130 [Candidatus Polarisedimenticolia bacterium]|nr:hypothetical protein [Candidatus Polarisedimenticolia bacterium]
MNGADAPARSDVLRPPRILFLVLPALLAPVAVFGAFVVAALSPPAGRVALPVFATLALYPIFARCVGEGRRAAAITAALLWAASLSASLITHVARDPGAAGAGVLMGPPYRDEMFAFLASGSGRESDPARFVPQHLLHAGIFAVATFVSGGLLGLAMGAVLVGYMSYYVGALASGPHPITAGLLGWPPWAIVRVIAFVMLGAVLARPLLVRLRGRPERLLAEPADRRLLGVALALLLFDIVLKATFAPAWSEILRPCLPP